MIKRSIQVTEFDLRSETGLSPPEQKFFHGLRLFPLRLSAKGCMQLMTNCRGNDMSTRKIYSAIDAAAMRRRKRAYLSVGRQELCDYVADFALEFHQVTSDNDMRFLSYLLAMVVEEALHQSKVAAGHDVPSNASPSGALPSDS